MRKFLSAIGYTEELPLKHRFTYVINAFSIFLLLLFAVFYVLKVQSFLVNLVTGLCLLDLLGVQVLLKRRIYFTAKILMISGFLFQEFSLVFLWFPVEANFNYFYFIVAPISFFIFDFQITAERYAIILSNLIAALFLLLSEILSLDNPLISLESFWIDFFSGLSVLSTIASILIVFYFYASSLSKIHRELAHLASTDSLTQVGNGRTLFDRGEELLRISRQYKGSFCFLIFDLDFFKKVNDSYGHPAGDAVLIQVTELIRKSTRQEDLFSRYGGEEFALILNHADLAKGSAAAEKIRREIEEHTFCLKEGDSLHLTVSIGLVAFNSSFKNLDEMILEADKALYRAKEQGRNHVVASE